MTQRLDVKSQLMQSFHVKKTHTELEALRCFEIVLLSTGLDKTLVSDKGQLNTSLGGTHRIPTRFS